MTSHTPHRARSRALARPVRWSIPLFLVLAGRAGGDLPPPPLQAASGCGWLYPFPDIYDPTCIVKRNTNCVLPTDDGGFAYTEVQCGQRLSFGVGWFDCGLPSAIEGFCE